MAKALIKLEHEFSETLQAFELALNAETRHSWDVADAVLKETEGDRDKLKRAAETLTARGFKCNMSLLKSYCRIARTFPPNRRYPNIGFWTHIDAGSPELLDLIVASVPEGTRIGKTEIRQGRLAIRRQEQKLLFSAREAAEADKASAKAAIAAAEERERKAGSREVRSAAKDAKRRAQKQLHEAEHRAKQAETAPVPIGPPAPEEKLIASVVQGLLIDAKGVQVDAASARRAVKEHAGSLAGFEVNVVVDAWLSAAQACREVADSVRKTRSNKRGHLAVVNE